MPNPKAAPSRATQPWVTTYTAMIGPLVALLVGTACVGLFGAEVYGPFAPPKYVQESRAQDTITLTLGVPLLIASLLGVRRRRAWAYPLAGGALSYELYVYVIYVLGGVYNRLFLAYVAAASVSLYALVTLLANTDADRFQGHVSERMPRRWIAGALAAMAVLFAGIWISAVTESIATGVQDSGHLIYCIDLMIVLPAYAITATKLFQRRPLGDLLAGVMLYKLDSLCIAIALGQAFRARHGIAIEAGLLLVFAVLGVIGLALTWLYFRNLETSDIKE